MSLFGSTPPDSEPAVASTPNRSRSGGLFDDDDDNSSSRHHSKKASSNSLFADEGGDGSDSPWDMPTPRKQQSRAELIRNLLPAADVPESYVDTFDIVVRLDDNTGRVGPKGVAKLFSSASIGAEAESRIKSLVGGKGHELSLGRSEFNVLLALVGLAQEGEYISLDGVDERRKSKSTLYFLSYQVSSPTQSLTSALWQRFTAPADISMHPASPRCTRVAATDWLLHYKHAPRPCYQRGGPPSFRWRRRSLGQAAIPNPSLICIMPPD
jgi:sorting nexin-8